MGDDDAIHLEASLLKGLPMGSTDDDMPWISEIGGTWPDGMFLTVDMIAASGSTYRYADVFRWTNDGWSVAKKKVDATPGTPDGTDNFHYADFAPWKDGRVLALAVYENPGAGIPTTVMDFQTAKPRLDIVAGDSTVQTPQLDPALCPDRLLSLPSGEIFVLGQRCATGAVSAQRWRASDGPASKGTTEQLPAPPSSCEGGRVWVRDLEGRTGDDVYVAAQITCPAAAGAEAAFRDIPYLVHFDGRAWSLAPAPAVAGTAALSVAPDGSLWATTDEVGDSALWRRLADGRWEAVALPKVDSTLASELLVARDVYAKSARDVWVVAGRYDTSASPDKRYRGSAVMHTRAAKEVVRFPNEAEIRSASADVSLPSPANASCANPFLAIARLPASAGEKFDYADLRAAAKGRAAFDGVELREVMWRRERWVGAVGEYDALEKLRTAAVEALPDSVAHPFCRFYPRLLRSFAIDSHTGDLLER